MSTDKKHIVFDTRKEVDFVIIGSGASGGSWPRNFRPPGLRWLCWNRALTARPRISAMMKSDVMLLNEMTEHPCWEDPQTFRQRGGKSRSHKRRAPPGALCPWGRRQQCAFHGQLLADAHGRF